MEIPAALTAVLPSSDAFFGIVSGNPLVQTLQFALAACAALLVFLVFWTTRDILRRSRSLFIQLPCILLVAALPIVGFFLYLLIRPSKTLAEKEMAESVQKMLTIMQSWEVRRNEAAQKMKSLKAKTPMKQSALTSKQKMVTGQKVAGHK